jgi:hypothetical protein
MVTRMKILGRSRDPKLGWLGTLGFSAGLLAVGCAGDDTPKAWSALSTCLAGKAAKEPLPARVQAMRLIQLAGAASAAKDAWPKRCAPYADDLYASLGTSADTALLRGKMEQKLRCSPTKGSCTLPTDSSLLTATTDLWDAAKSMGLSSEPAASVPAPESSPPPLLDSKGWKVLSEKPAGLAGPTLTSDGRGILLLKVGEGRSRPRACEFTDGLSKVRCFDANPAVPELPVQSIEVVSDAHGVFAAGLTDSGLVAYNLANGEKSDVRGRSGHLLREGVVVERGTKDDVSQAPPPPMPSPLAKPAKGAKGKGKGKGKADAPPKDVKEEGFVAVELSGNKASKDIKLPIKAPVGDPVAIGDQVLFLNANENGADLVAKSLSHGHLKDVVTLKGGFAGSFHTCEAGSMQAVAVFGGRTGQNSAKPTAGAGKTQISITFFQNGTWSKVAETTMPFERALNSELVCTKTGASLAWVKPADNGVQVGRVDCSPEGCKASDATLPGVESKWWWALGPLGDKVFIMWRAGLGETRLRVGSIAELATAKDSLHFDSPDYGGPTAGEISPLLTEQAALLVFRNEQPAVLRIAADGSAKLLTL